MDKWNEMLSVSLTVAQWLDVQCALSDARRYNEEQNFNCIARDIARLKTIIAAYTAPAIDAASAASEAEAA